MSYMSERSERFMSMPSERSEDRDILSPTKEAR
jgi:hypothetical protein